MVSSGALTDEEAGREEEAKVIVECDEEGRGEDSDGAVAVFNGVDRATTAEAAAAAEVEERVVRF